MQRDTAGSCLTDDTVTAFANRALDDTRARAVRDHIGVCSDCRELVAEAARFVDHEDSDATTVAHAEPTQPREPLPEGATIGRYRLARPVGQGGMGVVYAAYDTQLRRKIALKLMHSQHGQDDRIGSERLLREARAMARLSHWNVVTVYDAGAADGEVFVAMEYVEGRTLRAWLRDERPRWREIIDVFCEAGRGLAAAHAVGLVHRDFKPANVLLSADGRVRVTDFGLARPIEAGSVVESGATALPDAPDSAFVTFTRTGAVAGTLAYMAPEQLLATTVGPSTDQFSFSVALYAALYGCHPFADRSEDIPAAVLGGTMRAPVESEVPDAVLDVLARAMRSEPEQRHRAMLELIDALSVASRPSPAPPRRRWPRVAAAAVVVLSMGLGGWAAWALSDSHAVRRASPRARASRSAVVERPAVPASGSPPPVPVAASAQARPVTEPTPAPPPATSPRRRRGRASHRAERPAQAATPSPSQARDDDLMRDLWPSREQ